MLFHAMTGPSSTVYGAAEIRGWFIVGHTHRGYTHRWLAISLPIISKWLAWWRINREKQRIAKLMQVILTELGLQ